MKRLFTILVVLSFLLYSAKISAQSCWQQISVGTNHTLVIKPDGTLWAWGWNYKGQLGDGTNIEKDAYLQHDS